MSVFHIPDLPQESHFVYCAFCQDSAGAGYVKFGRSKRIGSRLSAIRTTSPLKVLQFAVVQVRDDNAAVDVERALHNRFRDRRHHGEWFLFDFASAVDKRDFNDGSVAVFASAIGAGISWTKINIEALDADREARRQEFLHAKNRKEIERRRRVEEIQRRAARELERPSHLIGR